MEIKILAFGIAKDIIKDKNLRVTLPPGASVGLLKNFLLEKYPDFGKLRSLAVAVNTEYCTDDHLLAEADEVVLIPPVSGG